MRLYLTEDGTLEVCPDKPEEKENLKDLVHHLRQHGFRRVRIETEDANDDGYVPMRHQEQPPHMQMRYNPYGYGPQSFMIVEVPIPRRDAYPDPFRDYPDRQPYDIRSERGQPRRDAEPAYQPQRTPNETDRRR